MESLQSYIDVMVRQIRDSHEKKEEALENRIRELKAVVKEMVQKNEKLSSAYRFVKFSPRFFKRLFELSRDKQLSFG